MEMTSVYKLYFSATGTTERIVNAIADGIISDDRSLILKKYDFTLPKARQSFPELKSDELVIFGLPTYAGRVPNVLLKYLDTINGNGAFAVPIVTFGNRAFDNSLIELRNILENKGFRTVAAAAFSCEHSFSYSLGAGRPDADDFSFAEKFTSLLIKKLKNIDTSVYSHIPIFVDGDENASYFQPKTDAGQPIDIRKVKPKTSDKCDKCGVCVNVCPMGSISSDDCATVNGVCIKCGACLKKCPNSAKYFDDADYLYHKHQIERDYQRRAENKMFL
ncbi:MAG: EFR1 family ferrodoxin [Candidatus Limimorpha sp.]